MPICQLCHLERTLCKSHIVPEFLYSPLYNDKNTLMAISGSGNKGWKPLNKGITEHLLCSDCEKLINDKYEKPFKKEWEGKVALPENIFKGEIYTATYNYSKFKLFHLSILFRASVSTNPMFHAVKLGKHEEIIRKMLIVENPGEPTVYPILAFAITDTQNKVEKKIITQPTVSRIEGHLVYSQIYAGAMWSISVSSHPNQTFIKCGLQPTGDINFIAEPLSEIAIIRDASRALKRSQNKVRD